MSTRGPSSSSSSSSNSSTTASPPTVSQPKVSDTIAPPTPSNSSAQHPQSPPPAVPIYPPPSPPFSPLPAATPPTSPPSGSPPVASPLPLVSSPPPPARVSSPKLSPPPPVPTSPPASPLTKAPSPLLDNSLPPPLAKPPQNSYPPAPSDSPPALEPPKSFPLSPPVSISPPLVPSSSSQSSISPPLAPSNLSVNGTSPMTHVPILPLEKPTAESATSGPDMANVASKGSSGGMLSGPGVAIGIVVGVLAVSLVVMVAWFTRKRKRRGAELYGGYGMPSSFASFQNSGSSFLRLPKSTHLAGSTSGSTSRSNLVYSTELGQAGNSRYWFTYEELANATNGFSTQNLLGEGGFGCVYKGCLLDGRQVAVKQLKIGGGQGEREFRAEVEIISRVHHRHLVTLVGYCISEHQRLLVYDYVPNNTLHYHLHGKGRPVMQWETRVKVAAGAARGIAYLHEDCHPRIIHRDIKSTNILLDNSFEARVADFGLAKLALDANTHVTTRVMGTFGYMAPEYASSGKLTEKSDVFSFGVVLLEFITGRKPVDASQPLGDESLVEWARPLLAQALESGKFEELIDPSLENNYVETEMFGMIEAAAVCIRHSASKRPLMSQVVRALDSINELSDITNGMKPGQSEIFNSGEQSAQITMFQRMTSGSEDCSSEFFDHLQSCRRV